MQKVGQDLRRKGDSTVSHYVQLQFQERPAGTSRALRPADPRRLRTFMGEVAPRVRERVAARRAAEQETRV